MILEDDRKIDFGADRGEVVEDALFARRRLAVRRDHDAGGAQVGRYPAQQNGCFGSAVARSDDDGDLAFRSFDGGLDDGLPFLIDQTIRFPEYAQNRDAVHADVDHEANDSRAAVEIDGFVVAKGHLLKIFLRL